MCPAPGAISMCRRPDRSTFCSPPDYFEIRYENPAENRRYFYQLDGEGIRYEIVAFLKSIEKGRSSSYVEEEVSEAIAGVMEDFYSRRDTRTI